MKAKWNNKKGCALFAVQVIKNEKVDSEIEGDRAELLRKYHVFLVVCICLPSGGSWITSSQRDIFLY